MKKMLILLFMLILCLSSSALADAPIVISTAGNHTITLSGETIIGSSGPAIDIKSPDAKVTIVLKNNTTTTLTGADNYAGISTGGADIVIRCEGAGENHTCTDSCGRLIVNGGKFGAGIGGNNNEANLDPHFEGSLAITGGHITANGGYWASGIGGGNSGAFNGSLTISGGTVNATGNEWGAGIGSADNVMTGSVTISGGIVEATGGYGSAGIGSSGGGLTKKGSISITGGTVTATGGENSAGIGSGSGSAMSGKITISGGNVTANGAGSSAGIGAGNNGILSGTVVLSGGTVTANGGNNAAGIGSGARGKMSGTVIVKGGNVTAIAGNMTMDGATEPASAIGASCLATLEDSAVIEVNPASGKIAAKAGANVGSAAALEGSPFTAKTSLKEALKDKQYAKFEYIAPPATPVPATPTPAPNVPATPTPAPNVPATPTPAPSVPATGDSMNFALLAVLAAVSMIGITVILRKKNEA